MVNLHRWLKRTSPHLVIAGSLLITGLSGCRSTPQSAVTFESPTSVTPAYPAPLMVPEGVPYTESETASVDADGNLFLEPPAPPVTGTGTNTATGANRRFVNSGPKLDPFDDGAPPKIPLPEDSTSEELTREDSSANELTAVEPLPEAVKDKNSGKVATSDPLAETNLFPEDNPAVSGTTKDTVLSSPDLDTEPATAPLVSTFEPTVTNPEVPVPNPGQNTVGGDLPELDPEEAFLPSTVNPDTTDSVLPLTVVEQPAQDPPSLFPPPQVRIDLPEVTPNNSNGDKQADDELPITLPNARSGDAAGESGLNPDDGGAAFLPAITPAIVAVKSRQTSRLDLPLPEVSASKTNASNKSSDPSTADHLVPVQPASIAKPDGKLPTAAPLTGNANTSPLFPKASTRPAGQPDVISVVAEVWSPADSVVFDESGNAFVSHGEHISKISPDGSVEPWATMSSPRGHVILPDGSHLVCDTGQRAVVQLNADGEQVRKVATRSDGSFLRAPNDLVVDSNGGVYFTDPGYARIRNPIGQIHYIAADGSVEVVVQRLAFPEGIALSSDGAKLLVVEGQAGQIVEFEILSPGEVGPKRVFATLPTKTDDQSDDFANGLVVDQKTGRVFVAHGQHHQMEILSPDGQFLRSVETGIAVNGVAFKANDFSRIFVTGSARTGKENIGQLLEIRIAD
jgi:gluconolactonase